jgi:hypothetical protein
LCVMLVIYMNWTDRQRSTKRKIADNLINITQIFVYVYTKIYNIRLNYSIMVQPLWWNEGINGVFVFWFGFEPVLDLSDQCVSYFILICLLMRAAVLCGQIVCQAVKPSFNWVSNLIYDVFSLIVYRTSNEVL